MISKVLAAITASITATLTALMLAPSAFAMVPPEPSGGTLGTSEQAGVLPWQVGLIALGALVAGIAMTLVAVRAARALRERPVVRPAVS